MAVGEINPTSIQDVGGSLRRRKDIKSGNSNNNSINKTVCRTNFTPTSWPKLSPQLLLLIIFLGSAVELCEGKSESRVVCYYTNWSAYRQGPAKFLPDNINPYLCTHLIYAFGGITSDSGIKPFDKYQDLDKGGYTKFNGLKTYNKALKTLVAIGGWNEGSRRFSALVADPEARKKFITLAIRFLRQHHFDGLDLDWEYPAAREGGVDEDKPNYAQFIKELREAFEDESRSTGRTRLLLTIAVPAGVDTIEKGFDIHSINRDVDFFNILTYDYHASTEPQVNHHAPLRIAGGYSAYDYKSQLNIEYTIQYYLKEGADADKLVVGIPTYGRSYTLFNVESMDVGAPASGPGTKGKFTKEAGYLAYYEICEGIKSGQWRVENENNDYQGPHAINGDQWVGYDDTRIAALKAKWVREMNLGGIMFWSVDNDDFRGSCHGKPFPIIEAAKQAYYINENTASSSRPNSRFPVKSSSKSSNRLSNRYTTTPAPPSTTTSRRKKNKKNKNKRRSKPRTTPTIPTTTPSTTTTPSNPLSTPAPPTTPDPGVDFECKDEGFFPHPRECKKYFWCLDAPGLGLVAHHFTCPAGLFFNKLTDSCDYARNVPCKPGGTTTTTTTTTSTTTKPTTTTTTTTAAPEDDEYYDDEDEEEDSEEEEDEAPQIVRPRPTYGTNSGKSAKEINDIKDLLRIIKKLGGVEELEKYLEENPSAAQAVKEFNEEEAAQEQDEEKPAKKSFIPSRFTPSPNPNRSRFKPSTSNSSPVINPLRYTNIQRTKSSSTTNSPTKKPSKYQEDVTEEDEEEDSKEEDFRPPSRHKPKENKEYVTLNRDKKTSSTETSVVVRISDDEKYLENTNDRGTTDKPYVTISRPYAKVTGESQVHESHVNTNRLRYISLSRRPSNNNNEPDETEVNKRKSAVNRNAAEESDNDKTEEEDVTEEEEDEPVRKPSSATYSTRPASPSTTTPESISSTPRPRLRIPTRKTLGFSRTRNTFTPRTTSTTTTTEKPIENSSFRRSRAFSVSNRKNLLAERRRNFSTSSTSTTPAPVEEEEEEEATDESPAESVDDFSTNRVYQTSTTSTSTSKAPERVFVTSRGRVGAQQRHRPNEIHSSTNSPTRPRQRQRTRAPTTSSSIVSTTPYYSTKVTEVDEVYKPFQRIRRPTTTTLTPLTGSPNFQTAIIRRRTRKPSTTTAAPVLRRTTTRTTSTTTTTPSPFVAVTRYAPNVATTTPQDDAAEYYYYYYDDDDEPETFKKAASRDDLFDKSQTVRGQFAKRNLDLRTSHPSHLQPQQDILVNNKQYYHSSATVPLSRKIRLDDNGNIYCLDKGIFPHPKSCKKFVHCVAGEEDGDNKDVIRGWIYSCPELLTFDVVGGMCNWAPNGTNRNSDNSLCTTE